MLTGSPVTVLVSDYLEEVTGYRMGLFTIAVIGVPLLLVTIATVVLFGSRLIPVRTASKVLRDFGAHGATLARHYDVEGTHDTLMSRGRGTAEFVIPPRSKFIGDVVHRGCSPRAVNWWSRRCTTRARTSTTSSPSRRATRCCSRDHGRPSTAPPTIPTSWRSTTPISSGVRPCRWVRVRSAPSGCSRPW
nr:hypothetical protein [Tessaracoccus coleopterorum]